MRGIWRVGPNRISSHANNGLKMKIVATSARWNDTPLSQEIIIKKIIQLILDVTPIVGVDLTRQRIQIQIEMTFL